jgi:hypothetical protein
MNQRERDLEALIQEAEDSLANQERFAGMAVEYAKARNFSAFNERIERAIEYAEELPYRLRALQRFLATSP